MKHVPGDFAANLERHAYWLERTAELEPDFVGFPEFSLTGWIYDGGLRWNASELRKLAELAKRYNVHIGTGFVEKSGSALFNSCAIIAPGGLLGRMRKVNLIGKEAAHYRPGREFPVFDLGKFRIGVATCADSTRYEMFHLLSLRGAEIIFAPHANTLKPYGGHPNGWKRWRLERWPLFVRDTTVAVAGINNAGLFHDQKKSERNNYCGGGMILDENGEIISTLSGTSPKETIAYGEVDLESLRQARTKNRLMQDFQAEIIYRRKNFDAWNRLRAT
jgi:predicted amidohydrolase